jgi:transposase
LLRVASRFKTSEKLSRAQLLLFADALRRGEGGPAQADLAAADDDLGTADGDLLSAAGLDDDQPAKRRTDPPRRQPVRGPAPAHLRRVDNPLPVPAAERPCPELRRCARVAITPEVTEVIELIPAEVIVRRDVREKLACRAVRRCARCARRPRAKAVEGGKYGLRFVAQMLVDKYVDGLPLHRQRKILQRLGLDIAVSTLADQIKWSTDLLRPLWRAAVAEVIAAQVMHLDGTGLPVLDASVPGGKRLGALWGYVGVNAGAEIIAAYQYVSTGKATGQHANELGPEDMLALRTGLTVADASNLFDASFARPELIECGCNMHARRYFVKALDAGDQRAALAIGGFAKLYEIERELRGKPPDEVLAARKAQSQPVWDTLAEWVRVRRPHEPPSSPLGKALQYFTNHQVALGRFLEYGELPLDNGIVERLHVRAALTRKNFLFAGADAGGDRAAIADTILGSCQLAGVDPARVPQRRPPAARWLDPDHRPARAAAVALGRGSPRGGGRRTRPTA